MNSIIKNILTQALAATLALVVYELFFRKWVATFRVKSA